MNKKISILALSGALALGSAATSYAGWQQDTTGYWWRNEDGSYLTNGWHWLDGNGDGISECYYFDGNGYMASNTTTPDGYTVDGSGAWVLDGVVQTQGAGQASQEEAELDTYSFVVGDKIIRGDDGNTGDFSIIMTNLDGSGRQKLLDVYTVGTGQVTYGDSAYIVAQQEVGGAIHYVLYRVHLDGRIETVYDTADCIFQIFRNGNQIVINISANGSSGYYYITPEDYTLRSYDGELPMAGGYVIRLDREEKPESLGYYGADRYRIEDDYTIVTLDENGNAIRGDRLMGSGGKLSVLWGNDAYTVVQIVTGKKDFLGIGEYTNCYKVPVGGGYAEQIEGSLCIYNGNVYNVTDTALYRWDYQGNATKLMDYPAYNDIDFVNGYFFYRFGYTIAGIKL